MLQMEIGQVLSSDCRLTPQTNTSFFSVFCPHSHVFPENFPKGHPSQPCSPIPLGFRIPLILM
ncbi:hypothetical protein MTR_8g026690 [Medicago truncatula]|uniref:Uncharacterized protein n=1 Tax=Medicago truncatula TaxID=3880 RepID=G7L9Z2_MEDTR|nr:hypothetical protein MTR_8g026690 [Medicago truncatula]